MSARATDVVTPRGGTAVEDYLKAMFNLVEWDDQLSNRAIADRLGVSTASASEMVRKLAARGLVRHEKYGAVELTATGRSAAVEMVRRHRLIETYLVQALGYSWDEVHDEAEVLEHAVSPTLIERMAARLGDPWRDPHGDPIPTTDGVLHRSPSRPLLQLVAGDTGFVARIDDDDPVLLRWFAEQQVGLDVALRLVEAKPFGGSLVVQIGADRRPLDLGVQAQAALWIAAEPPRPTDRATCPFPGCAQHPAVQTVS